MKRFILLLFCRALWSAPAADISFFLADVKYNAKQGAKICEVQQGNISLFKGFDFIFQRKGVIGERLAELLSQYHSNFWFLENGITYSPMREHLIHHKWKASPCLLDLYLDPQFKKPVADPDDLKNYHAVVYGRLFSEEAVGDFQKNCPGALLMDAANTAYLLDKYKMSQLFVGDGRLEKVKPKWKLYPKRYNKQLAQQIIEEIGSDLLVIKPKSSSEGKGVIIIPKEQLDTTLKKITFDSKSLKGVEDRGYKFWEFDHSDSFLVEEYIPSDPIYPEHLGKKPFNATMRVVFVLVYHQRQVHLHYLGAYWIIPEKSIDEEGTLHERSKAYVLGTSYYCDVAKDTLEIVENQLREPLILMYKRMLNLSFI